MAWLVVCKDGQESIFECEPKYCDPHDWWDDGVAEVFLPKGTIEKILGRPLKFEECPKEI